MANLPSVPTGYQSNQSIGTTRIVDQFNTNYWNKDDLHVYFNTFLIEEAIQLNYMIVEQVRPFYNYAGYRAARIYHGTGMINGELTINFKNDGYLYSLLNQLNTSPVNKKQTTQTPSVPIVQVNPLSISNITNGSTLSSIVAALKAQEAVNTYSTNLPSINSSSSIFETQQPFDINIIFGAKLDAAQVLQFNTDGRTYIPKTANNLDSSYLKTGTGLKLIDVHLQANARSMDDSGRHIVETYTFIASDVQILTDGVDRSKNAISSSVQSSLNTVNQNANTKNTPKGQ